MSTITDFKGDLFSATWDHTIKMLKHSIVPAILYFAFVGVSTFVLFQLLGIDFEYLMETQGNQEAIMEYMEDWAKGMEDKQSTLQWQMIVIQLIGALFFGIISALTIVGADELAKGNSSNFFEWTKKINVRMIGHLILGVIMIVIGISLVSLLFTYIAGFIGFLGSLIGFILTFTLYCKLLPFTSAVVIGQKTAWDAIAWSYTNMTWPRSLKMFGGFILVLVVLIVTFFIVALLAGLLGNISPIIAVIISFGFYLFLFLFQIAGWASLTTGIWHRYNETNQHLELEELGSD